MKKTIPFYLLIFLSLGYGQSSNSLAETIDNTLNAPHVLEVKGSIMIYSLDAQGGLQPIKLLEIGDIIQGFGHLIAEPESREAVVHISCGQNAIKALDLLSYEPKGLAFIQIRDLCQSNDEKPRYSGYKGQGNNGDELSEVATTYVSALVLARAGKYDEALNTLEDYQHRYRYEEARFGRLITILYRALTL